MVSLITRKIVGSNKESGNSFPWRQDIKHNDILINIQDDSKKVGTHLNVAPFVSVAVVSVLASFLINLILAKWCSGYKPGWQRHRRRWSAQPWASCFLPISSTAD
jgi:hypothetical protein